MIQRLIILLEDCHAFSLSSFCFLPAHITAAHKLLLREIKNEIKFNSDHTATKVDLALESNRPELEHWMAFDSLYNLLESSFFHP